MKSVREPQPMSHLTTMQGAEDHSQGTYRAGRLSTNSRNIGNTHCGLPKQNSMYLRQFLVLKKKGKNNTLNILSKLNGQKCNQQSRTA